MNSSIKLKVLNDTQMDSGFYIYNNEKKPIFISIKKGNAYTISADIQKIFIKKEDVWENKGTMNFLILLLYSFDLIFGNMADSVNLPYYINEQLDISNFVEGKKEIYLSQIIRVNKDSINKWKLVSTVQQIFCCVLLICIGIVLSFLFNEFYKIIFIGLIVLLCIYLYRKLYVRKKELYEYLNEFSVSKKTGDGSKSLKKGDF